MNEIKFLQVEDVIDIHEMQLLRYGGRAGIRDMGLLESAVYAAQSGYGEVYFHETLTQMAAVYIYHIIQNHLFYDGNKRAGVISGLTFLRYNDIPARWTQDQMYEIGMKVASSKLTKEQLFKEIDRISFTA